MVAGNASTKASNGNGTPASWKPGQSGCPEQAAKWAAGDYPRVKSPGRPPVARALRKALRNGGMERVVAGVVESAADGDANAFGKIRDTIDGVPKQTIEQTIQVVVVNRLPSRRAMPTE